MFSLVKVKNSFLEKTVDRFLPKHRPAVGLLSMRFRLFFGRFSLKEQHSPLDILSVITLELHSSCSR